MKFNEAKYGRGNLPLDPEEAMQEPADWFVDLLMLAFTYAPLLPLVIYCAAMALTAIGIIIHYFPH